MTCSACFTIKSEGSMSELLEDEIWKISFCDTNKKNWFSTSVYIWSRVAYIPGLERNGKLKFSM